MKTPEQIEAELYDLKFAPRSQSITVLTEWRDECVEVLQGMLVTRNEELFAAEAERDRLSAYYEAEIEQHLAINRGNVAERDRLRKEVRQLRDQGGKTLHELDEQWQGMHEYEVQALRAENETLRKTLLHNGYRAR